jgi:phage-related baseplate assembly protein
VESYLTEEKRRPLTDRISVQSASILEYEVKAKIHVYQGPVSSIIQKNAKAELEKYVAKRHKIGEVIACSGIHDSLHMEGVKKVELIKPTEDIITTKEQAGYCTKIELEIINDG